MILKKQLFLSFNLTVFFSFFIGHFFSLAQVFPVKNYPKGYFIWPVQEKADIVANFGELRSNHYHMGLDCRTNGQVNIPVLAAADGYIAKIHVDATGFGKTIYMNHPNGLTTVYAHLNDLIPRVETYLKEQQYKQKSWKIDVIPPRDLFIFSKGTCIAFSGNSGGSQGPHLHFEIRDTKSDKALNPLLFGFPIPDDIEPAILKLSVYDRRLSTYEQTPAIISLKKINGIYQPINGLLNLTSDRISFAIHATDKYSGSANPNGIYKALLFKDNEEIIGFEMDSISYDDTRYMNAHIDFATKMRGGPYLQHLSVLPGYRNSIYKSKKNETGIITLKDHEIHTISIVVFDANGNSSRLNFEVRWGTNPSEKSTARKGPLFKTDEVNVFENESLSVYLPENTIYDNIHFEYHETEGLNNKIYTLQNPYTPIHNYFPVTIHAPYNPKDTGKVIMKLSLHQKDKFKKAKYEENGYRAYFRDFGKYQLILDTIPPSIKPIGQFREGIHLSGSNKIMFSASDNTKEIASFNGFIDNQWILFTNDKEAAFIYTIDQYCTPGEHSLKIIVKDLAGNTTIKNYHFTR